MSSLAEQNKDFRLLLTLNDELDNHVFDVVAKIYPSDEKEIVLELFNPAEHLHQQILLDEDKFLKFYERLIMAYIHMHDSKARNKLNEVIENLKV